MLDNILNDIDIKTVLKYTKDKSNATPPPFHWLIENSNKIPDKIRGLLLKSLDNR